MDEKKRNDNEMWVWVCVCYSKKRIQTNVLRTQYPYTKDLLICIFQKEKIKRLYLYGRNEVEWSVIYFSHLSSYILLLLSSFSFLTFFFSLPFLTGRATFCFHIRFFEHWSFFSFYFKCIRVYFTSISIFSFSCYLSDLLM